jgi:flagellar biosynthetic protein FliP
MKGILIFILAMGLLAASAAGADAAQSNSGGFMPPKISIGIGQSDKPADVTTSIKLLLLFTVLALLPSVLVMVTSFTRIVVVLGFLRQAMGTHQAPNNQILIGLALFMTVFIMWPAIGQVREQALDPYMAEEIGYDEAAQKAVQPFRIFMLA